MDDQLPPGHVRQEILHAAACRNTAGPRWGEGGAVLMHPTRCAAPDHSPPPFMHGELPMRCAEANLRSNNMQAMMPSPPQAYCENV